MPSCSTARVYGTPSYHVQALLAKHRADVVLPSEVSGPSIEVSNAGMVGVGTWATQAEFKDFRVTQNGNTLLAADFAKGLKGWHIRGGHWEAHDGVLRQTGDETDIRGLTGRDRLERLYPESESSQNRRQGGILDSVPSADARSKSWWNIGGWGNREHGLEVPGLPSTHVPGSVETGRWYDIRVEIKGGYGAMLSRRQADPRSIVRTVAGDVRCSRPLSSQRRGDRQSGQRIQSAPSDDLDDRGRENLSPTAKIVVLTSASREDENSLDEPKKVGAAGIENRERRPRVPAYVPGPFRDRVAIAAAAVARVNRPMVDGNRGPHGAGLGGQRPDDAFWRKTRTAGPLHSPSNPSKVQAGCLASGRAWDYPEVHFSAPPLGHVRSGMQSSACHDTESR